MTSAPDARARVDDTLTRIARYDAGIGAFTQVFTEQARAAAADLQFEQAPLHGVPVAVKEIVDVAGADACYGSPALAGRVAERDAWLVTRLRQAGAVLVGQTRSHEFAWGITSQQAERGGTRNPWNPDRVPGGSSGGSAAAVAAGLVPLAVASDTGGSVRIPASFCGVFGLKTTWGRIGRTGMLPLAPSFDSPGFLAREVSLLAAALAATAGPDPGDPASQDAPPHPVTALDLDRVGSVRFAVPAELGPVGAAPDRIAALETVTAGLRALGASEAAVTVPDAVGLLPVFAAIQQAEAYHTHHRVLGWFPRLADRYGADVRDRLAAAAGVCLADYLSARQAAAVVRGALVQSFRQVDLLVGLVGATGPSTMADPDQAPVRPGQAPMPLRQAIMPCTVPQNLAGLPSVTVPAGFDDDGLPVGVQLTGAAWSEPLVLAVAAALERSGVARCDLPAAFR
jgi:aspartyl-tRNA(Asn)/glutamyl-tRNA(Gln) amidotransferase subunit A